MRYGITSVSVNPDSIETARKIIASVEKKIILEKLTGMGPKDEDERRKYYG